MPRSIFLLAALLVCIAPLHADVTHVDNTALERLLQRGVPIIDIRTPEEWSATGIIEGSHLLTFFDAQGRYDAHAWLSELATIAGRDQAFALICDSGVRSGVVSRALDGQLGYRHVFNVPGGIAQWIAEDRPTVDPRQAAPSPPAEPESAAGSPEARSTVRPGPVLTRASRSSAA